MSSNTEGLVFMAEKLQLSRGGNSLTETKKTYPCGKRLARGTNLSLTAVANSTTSPAKPKKNPLLLIDQNKHKLLCHRHQYEDYFLQLKTILPSIPRLIAPMIFGFLGGTRQRSVYKAFAYVWRWREFALADWCLARYVLQNHQAEGNEVSWYGSNGYIV